MSVMDAPSDGIAKADESASSWKAPKSSVAPSLPALPSALQRGPRCPPAAEAHAVQNMTTIQEHVKRVSGGRGIPPERLADFAKCHEFLVKRLQEVQMAPSVMQFAVAAAANLNMAAELHQVWSQPPGTGKTRTLAALVYVMASLGGYKDITIRCPGKHILEQDKEVLAELAEAVKAAGTVVRLRCGVQGLGQLDTVELIDECDTFILDNDRFDQLRHGLGAFIGLTATPLKDGPHSTEADLVAALGIHIHDSLVPPMCSLEQT